jgi:hypothetical protein
MNVYYPQIKLSYSSTKETERIINSLKLKNSHGYDEMSLKILKLSVLLYVALTLRNTFNFHQPLLILTSFQKGP